MRSLRLVVVSLVVGCGGASATTSVEIAAPLPSASSNPSPNGTTDPLSCEPMGAPIASPRGAPSGPPVAAGQMTEEAARAKRLFDSEKWSEALTALDLISGGASGDDEGNKQLAAYHRAIVFYRLRRYAESYAAFSAMARDRSHIKHLETLLWLGKMIIDHPALVDLTDFASYERSDIERFHNGSQIDLWATLTFVLGRERLREGATSEARELLSRVPPDHPMARYVPACLARAASP